MYNTHPYFHSASEDRRVVTFPRNCHCHADWLNVAHNHLKGSLLSKVDEIWGMWITQAWLPWTARAHLVVSYAKVPSTGLLSALITCNRGTYSNMQVMPLTYIEQLGLHDSCNWTCAWCQPSHTSQCCKQNLTVKYGFISLPGKLTGLLVQVCIMHPIFEMGDNGQNSAY